MSIHCKFLPYSVYINLLSKLLQGISYFHDKIPNKNIQTPNFLCTQTLIQLLTFREVQNNP